MLKQPTLTSTLKCFSKIAQTTKTSTLKYFEFCKLEVLKAGEGGQILKAVFLLAPAAPARERPCCSAEEDDDAVLTDDTDAVVAAVRVLAPVQKPLQAWPPQVVLRSAMRMRAERDSTGIGW